MQYNNGIVMLRGLPMPLSPPAYKQGGERVELTISEKIKLLAGRRGLTMVQIAQAIGQTRQNLNSKMKRETLTDDELRQIAQVLGCTYKSVFVMNDTGEEV